MPFGIRPSNVRVCHSTTRARVWKMVDRRLPLATALSHHAHTLALARKICRASALLICLQSWQARRLPYNSDSITSMSTSKMDSADWIKIDLHIHTLDDPKDVIDYSAHQLLERAKQLGFGVLAITLHDAVFDRAEVFADAAAMGILLIPAAEVRLQGADAILLNVTASEVAGLKNFEDLRQLRVRRGLSATANPSSG